MVDERSLTPDLVHPGYGKTVSELLVELEDPNEPPALLPIIPFPSPSLPVQNNPYRPVIMGILNVTPDSFSDGSANRVVKDESSSLEHVLQLARDLVADGAGILDIGGMSTRPGVDDKDVSVEEELARVVPVIQALRIEGIKVPISIDTFRPEVAEQAILAGASCINDVRGGREEGMLEVMAKMDVPVVLMHSRGDSKEMLADKAKNYDDLGGVVAGVNQELKETVRRAEQAGIKRWNIILDPGIGFAKTLEGNLKLLKSLEELFGKGSGLEGFAALIGASRKGFIGTILDKPIAKDREWGNAVVSARAASSGVVDIVRVHEPSPARDVITMTGAIYAS
jgi:dihydroneopterin aldolase/2-amino-4-hydroxy-6-hydroxymethyldihydropteridine diphosphokinase/dihydropteroate synthase